MKFFTDCSGPCLTCATHFAGNCWAGHGDDEYYPAKPEDVEALLRSGVTSGGRKLESDEKKVMGEYVGMIFTVGRTKGYEKYMDEDPKPGKGEGGSVWETREEAERYLEETGQSDYSVYGVLAYWDTETAAVEGVTWRSLTRPADLVRL